MVSEAIIIGGGNSIKEGISLGLKEKLKDKFIVAINYAYRHFPHTFLTFSDKNYYVPENAKSTHGKNPDIYEDLKKESLIIGVDHKDVVKKYQLSNTILLKRTSHYWREQSLKRAFYIGNLTGVFTIGLVAFLMNYKGIIYLLGYDWSRQSIPEDKYTEYSDKIKTHYYNDIKHRGIGYTGYFDRHDADKHFKYFLEPDLKIYNVSLNSNINCFEKISYEQMFELLNKETYNQEELRIQIKEKLQCTK